MDSGNYRGRRFYGQNTGRGRGRGKPTNDWRLTKLLDDWEQEQLKKEKEMELIAKKQDRKEFTKDLAKIILLSDKNRKRRTSTSSDSSNTSLESSNSTNSPQSSPEKPKKKKLKHKKKRSKKQDNELQKTLLDIQKNSEKLRKDIQGLRESQNDAQDSIHSHIQTIQEDIKTLGVENEKLHMAYHQLKKDFDKKMLTNFPTNLSSQPSEKKFEESKKINPIVLSDHDSSNTEDNIGSKKIGKKLKNTGETHKDPDQDDPGFDLALEFNLTACECRGDVNRKFKGAEGTTKLKKYCQKANIPYTNKNDAIKEVWAKLDPVLNLR